MAGLRQLSPEEVKTLGLESEPTTSAAPAQGGLRKLSSDEVQSLGLDAAPSETPEAPGALETFARGVGQSVTYGQLNKLMAVPKVAEHLANLPPDQQLDFISKSMRAGLGNSERRTGPIPPEAAAAEKEQEEREASGFAEHPVAGWLGLLSPSLRSIVVGGMKAGLKGLLPKLRAGEAKYAQQFADKFATPAAETLRSATGTEGAATARGSRIIEDLSGRMDEALAPSTIAENKAALSTADASELAESLAGKSRAELPGALGHIETAKALRQAADQAFKDALEEGKTMEAAMQAWKRTAKAQAKRYAIPAAAATAGYLSGDDTGDKFTRATTGGTLGLLLGSGRVSPALRAIGRTLGGSPEAKRLAFGASANIIDRIIERGSTQGGKLGAMAKQLAIAGARSSDAQAVAHHIFYQDKDYQQLARESAGESTP